MSVKTAIDPKVVKQLREETNAGMMDCKRALEEAGGDFNKAETILRKFPRVRKRHHVAHCGGTPAVC